MEEKITMLNIDRFWRCHNSVGSIFYCIHNPKSKFHLDIIQSQQDVFRILF